MKGVKWVDQVVQRLHYTVAKQLVFVSVVIESYYAKVWHKDFFNVKTKRRAETQTRPAAQKMPWALRDSPKKVRLRCEVINQALSEQVRYSARVGLSLVTWNASFPVAVRRPQLTTTKAKTPDSHCYTSNTAGRNVSPPSGPDGHREGVKWVDVVKCLTILWSYTSDHLANFCGQWLSLNRRKKQRIWMVSVTKILCCHW